MPIDVVKRSIAQLREDGKAHYAYLGVPSTPLYPQLVEHFELDVDKGAWIQNVNPGGPAEEAGLRGGSGQERFQGAAFRPRRRRDHQVGGKPVADADDLVGRDRPLQARRDRVDVEIHRGGETQTIEGQARRAPALATPSGG